MFDDTSSYVILSIFFSHFYLVLIQNKRVLEHLPMVFGTFCNVLYLSHVILVFPKHNSFRVFWCNSRRNHANRQNKTSWRLVKILGRAWMKIQEASEDITKGGIILLSSKTTYMEGNTQKDEETCDYGYDAMRLGHGFYT